jgi:hypothetical protein
MSGIGGHADADSNWSTKRQEEQPKVTYGAKNGMRRRYRNTSEAQGKSGRDEINNYPIRRLPWAAKVTFALKNVHRKSLMLQRFSCLRVDMLAEFGNRRPR